MENGNNRGTIMDNNYKNCVIGTNVKIGENVIIKDNCIIEDNVVIGDNCYIDYNCVIRERVYLGNNSFVAANCILGEYLSDFCGGNRTSVHSLIVGENSIIRSGCIIYTDSIIGAHFQTGHQVTIREKTQIGNNVSIGTLSDIQGNCKIGNYVRMHSNVHIGQLSIVDDYVWIYPYVVLTNDPTPPSETFKGVHVCSFAVIATGSIIMPGLEIGQDALIGAGAIVTKSVNKYEVAVGNPAHIVSDVRKIKNKDTGDYIYPWREHFGRYMPWDQIGFNNWYDSISIEQRTKFNVCGDMRCK